jgi:antirestriction protein ArdC
MSFPKKSSKPSKSFKKTTASEQSAKAKDLLLDLVLKAFASGIVFWQRPYMKKMTAPANLVTWLSKQLGYRGAMNRFLLSLVSEMQGYDSRFWISFDQAKKLGGHVKEKESGTPVFFWKHIPIYKKDASGTIMLNAKGEKIVEKTIPFLQYFKVFNTNQTDGLQDKIPTEENVHVLTENDFSSLEKVEALTKNWSNAPEISYGHNRACYSPKNHKIMMPEKTQFYTVDKLTLVYLHELVHSTGPELKRFSADSHDVPGDKEYSLEELVAEAGAVIIATELGIEVDFDNSAAYIAGWTKAFQDNPGLISSTFSRAQKAAELLLGYKLDDEETDESTESEDTPETPEALAA